MENERVIKRIAQNDLIKILAPVQIVIDCLGRRKTTFASAFLGCGHHTAVCLEIRPGNLCYRAISFSFDTPDKVSIARVVSQWVELGLYRKHGDSIIVLPKCFFKIL